jgi:hypothetical protein
MFEREELAQTAENQIIQLLEARIELQKIEIQLLQEKCTHLHNANTLLQELRLRRDTEGFSGLN